MMAEFANVAGRADLTTINGGELDVASGGHVLRTTINAHGVENLSGEFVDTMVQKTGIENVLSGGVSKNAKVYGVETVALGGVTDHALIYGGGGRECQRQGRRVARLRPTKCSFGRRLNPGGNPWRRKYRPGRQSHWRLAA